MTKIHVISGFLGAGKTTLIKKLLQEAFQNQKIILIENEFGEIGIDGGFLKEAGIEITEMNSGCICCSLVGDFGEALGKVLETYAPDHILIEPSGVGKLSDVIKAIQDIAAENSEVLLGGSVTVADASKCKIYMKNFGEFFNNQIENAQTIILSRTQNLSQEKLNACVALIQEHNTSASIITTPWDQLSGEKILAVIEKADSLAQQLLEEENEHHHHHHHHHEDGEECHCHDHEHEHEHHHHHEDGEECHCHCHEHGHHHHHHADEVFTSWGKETPKKFEEGEIRAILAAFDTEAYGTVLRAKGIVAAKEGQWIHFDYVPGEPDIRRGSAGVTGRLCVIGSGICEDRLAKLFGL